MNNKNKTAYCADWVLPGCSPPIHRGAVVVDANGITEFVGPRADLPEGIPTVIESPGSVITPGLINAHTHLEFSTLDAPLGFKGIEFTQWIEAVVAYRMATGGGPEASHAKAQAIASGIAQSKAAGVAAIGEIATSPLTVSHYHDANSQSSAGLHLTVFHEQLGSDEAVFDQKLNEIEAFWSAAAPASLGSNFTSGISPHAPYSVGAELLNRLIKTSKSRKCPVAMHLAETLAERDFVENKTGPFVDMLKRFKVWRPAAYRHPDSILNTLELLAQCERALVIHGNYLNAVEMDFIASRKDRLSVVYCPRTHAYFGHTRYPIEELLGRGISVAVGTDSRASNPDLNLVAELQHIRQNHRQLAPETILEMATRSGATALGLPPGFGTLQTGQPTVLSVIKNGHSSTPYDWLEQSPNDCLIKQRNALV